jgi:hypothetical protein
MPLVASAATVSTIFGATIPSTPDAADDRSGVEVGLKFKASANGQITGVRFYRGYENPAGYTVSLWTTSGALLGTASLPAQSPSSAGWRQANFATPVSVTAGTVYVASYFTSGGRYAYLNNGLANLITSGTLTALRSASSGGNGLYRYSSTSAFPTSTWQASNYYVDVTFTSTAGGAPVNGACGSANGAAVSAAPTTNLCASSIASAVTGSGPWGWTCAGSSGGADASCSAPKTAAQNCPIASSVDDGCPAASAGAPQLPNLFSAPFAPHTKPFPIRPPWNVAGVDYHVGYPSNITLKDPTVTANRPAGLSYNATTRIATVAANKTTVKGFDFCGAVGGPVGLIVAPNVMGSVVTQSKFCVGRYGSNAVIYTSGTSDITFTYNEIDGKAATHAGSGFNFDAAIKMTGSGRVDYEYNFLHDTDNKGVRFDGAYSVNCACIIYKHNLGYNFGMYGGHSGDHAEELFNYGGNGFYNGRQLQFNTSITQMWSVWASDPSSSLRANWNIGDTAANVFHTPDGHVNGNIITNNVFINEGIKAGTLTGPAFYNFQLGCNAGTCDKNVIADNYLDWSGGYYAWYALYGTITFARVGGNMSLISGRACNPGSWNITRGAKGTGTCS